MSGATRSLEMQTGRVCRNSQTRQLPLVELPIENRAVTAEYLRWFTEVQQIKASATTREVCENIIKRVTVHFDGTTQHKLRYVEHTLNFPELAVAERSDVESGTINATPPCIPGVVDWFVSHSWDSPWHGLVEAVEKHNNTLRPIADAKSPSASATMYWVDILAICQHYGTAHQIEDLPAWGTNEMVVSGFAKVLNVACQRGGGVLLYYQPLLEPKALRRVWCLYEMHQALQYEARLKAQGKQIRPISISINAADEIDFKLKLRTNNFSLINEGLYAIDARTAEATVLSDWDNIVEAILHSRHSAERGFDGVNENIRNEMRHWLADHAESLLKQIGVVEVAAHESRVDRYRRTVFQNVSGRFQVADENVHQISQHIFQYIPPRLRLHLENPFYFHKLILLGAFVTFPLLSTAIFTIVSEEGIAIISLSLAILIPSLYVLRQMCVHGSADCQSDKLPPDFPSPAALFFYRPFELPWFLRPRLTAATNWSVSLFFFGAYTCLCAALLFCLLLFVENACSMGIVYYVIPLVGGGALCSSFGFGLETLGSVSNDFQKNLYNLACAKLSIISCRLAIAGDKSQEVAKVKREAQADICAVMSIFRSLRGGFLNPDNLRVDICRCLVISGMGIINQKEKAHLLEDPKQNASSLWMWKYFFEPKTEENAYRCCLHRKLLFAIAEHELSINSDSNTLRWEDEMLLEMKQWPVDCVKRLLESAFIPNSLKADYRFKDLLRESRQVEDSPRTKLSAVRRFCIYSKQTCYFPCVFVAATVFIILYIFFASGHVNLSDLRFMDKFCLAANVSLNVSYNPHLLAAPCYYEPIANPPISENKYYAAVECMKASQAFGMIEYASLSELKGLPTGCFFNAKNYYRLPKTSDAAQSLAALPSLISNWNPDFTVHSHAHPYTPYLRAFCIKRTSTKTLCKTETSANQSPLCANSSATTNIKWTSIAATSYVIAPGINCTVDALDCTPEKKYSFFSSGDVNLTCKIL